MRVVELHVNGTTHRLEVDAERSLLSVLRDELEASRAPRAPGPPATQPGPHRDIWDRGISNTNGIISASV